MYNRTMCYLSSYITGCVVMLLFTKYNENIAIMLASGILLAAFGSFATNYYIDQEIEDVTRKLLKKQDKQ